jgi:hypothetical protein
MSLEETAAIYDGAAAVEDITRKGDMALNGVGGGEHVTQVLDHKNIHGEARNVEDMDKY